MPACRRRTLSRRRIALFNDPKLLGSRPTSTATRLNNLEAAHMMTGNTAIHIASQLQSGAPRKAAFLVAVRRGSPWAVNSRSTETNRDGDRAQHACSRTSDATRTACDRRKEFQKEWLETQKEQEAERRRYCWLGGRRDCATVGDHQSSSWAVQRSWRESARPPLMGGIDPRAITPIYPNRRY